MDGYTEGADLSAVGQHFSKPRAPESLPSWALLALHRLLDSPPACGRSSPPTSPLSVLFSAPALRLTTPYVGMPSGLSPPLLDLCVALGGVALVPSRSLSSIVRPRPSDSSPRARRSLLPTHREIRLLTQWGVPHLASAALIVFGHLERKIRAWLRLRWPRLGQAAFGRRLVACVPPHHIVR